MYILYEVEVCMEDGEIVDGVLLCGWDGAAVQLSSDEWEF